MPMIQTDALILDRTDFSNTSQILDIFTRDHGRVAALAKGIRQYGKRAYRVLDLLYHGRALILTRASREVQILTDFDIVDHFPGLRKHLPRYLVALHLLHLLRRALRPEAPEPRLFTLTLKALQRFSTAPEGRLPADVLAFDCRFLALLGFQLVLDRCPHCARMHAPGDPTVFVASAGGCVCLPCRNTGTQPAHRPILFSAAGRRLLRELALRSGLDRDQVKLTRAPVNEARKILNTALTSCLEAELPMLKYLPAITRSTPGPGSGGQLPPRVQNDRESP